jgi:hypothetical protein
MPKRKQLVPRNVTKFNVPCAFGGQASEVAIFIGNPEAKHNPIHFQSKFISDVRGGVIPQSVLESLEKLQKLSTENGVPFEELCRYALSSISENNQVNSEIPAPPTEAKDTVVEDNKITETSESEDKQTDMKEENR